MGGALDLSFEAQNNSDALVDRTSHPPYSSMTCSHSLSTCFSLFQQLVLSVEENFIMPRLDRTSEDVGGGGSRLQASTREPAVDFEVESPRDKCVHLYSFLVGAFSQESTMKYIVELCRVRF